MVAGFRDFFATSAGASAAFIGLLFVSLSVAAGRGGDHATRERRIVLGGSSSLALFDLVALYASALARAWEITWIRPADVEVSVAPAEPAKHETPHR